VRRALRADPGVRVVVTGLGQAAARVAADEWVPQVRGVVVCGLAGGTGGLARAGDVVVASGLWVTDGGAEHGVLGMELPGTLLGLVASVESAVDTPEARAGLRAAGAVAVEMEARSWAEVCARLRVPLVVVRALLDTPEEPLGTAATMVREGDRGPRAGAVLRAALHPGGWAHVVRVGRAAVMAERRAAETAVRAARALAAA